MIKKIRQSQRMITIILGVLTIAFFIFSLLFLTQLQPKMVAFIPLTNLEDSLLTLMGVGLLIVLVFFMLSLLRNIQYIQHAANIRVFQIVLLVSGLLSLLFVFSDVALLSDIHKQFRAGLDQPEWTLLFPVLVFQFATSFVFMVLQLSGFFARREIPEAVRDINVFLVVQYVGLVCGLLGLGLTSLGFVFQRGWDLHLHTLMGNGVILIPYILAVIYWLVTKLREKDRIWYDEKQLQDVGKSAFLSLVIDTLFLATLFIVNINQLDGVIRLIWLPLHLFAVMLLFSLGNLVFSSRG